MGEAGEEQEHYSPAKKLSEDEVKAFRTRFGIPISDDEVADAPFYRPSEDSAEMKYLKERRAALHGPVPRRQPRAEKIAAEFGDTFEEFQKGTEGRKASTTMVFVKMLSKLLKHETIGKLVVPIVPDEAHLRHGGAVSPGRHLCARRAAL